MSTEVITNILESHPFTEGFWLDHIARLSAMAGEVRFRPGEAIYREGDHSSLFYLLIEGNVALEVMSRVGRSRGDTVLSEVLGWSSVMDGHNGKQFQARALEEVRACLRQGAFAARLRRLRLRLLVHAGDSESDVRTDARNPGATGRYLLPVAANEHRHHSRAGAFDRRVALTPAVVALMRRGHTV